jgi:hypothetical protein
MFFWNARFDNDGEFAARARMQWAFHCVGSPARADFFGRFLGDDRAARQGQDEPVSVSQMRSMGITGSERPDATNITNFQAHHEPTSSHGSADAPPHKVKRRRGTYPGGAKRMVARHSASAVRCGRR